MKLDPITTEVLFGRLRELALTMEHVLYHSGYSPILRESQDGTAGLTDAEGRVVIVSGGLQHHSVPYTYAVRNTLERFPVERLSEGDSFVINDPYQAGTPHAPDMVTVTPVFHRGRLIAFTTSLAHKADIGGIVPGSSGAAAREIFHDGLLVPPVRFWSKDGINEDVEAIIRNNSRAPDSLIGDLRGQVGCTLMGAKRLQGLCEEYGADAVTSAMQAMLAGARRRLEAELARWPDGVHQAEGFLDNDGADLETPVRIHVTARKRGKRIRLDFSGSSGQTRGPVNCNLPTAQAVSVLAVLAASDPTIPMNSGLMEAIDFVTPAGSVVHPRFPATLNHYFPTCHLVYVCVLAAVGQFNPARAVAPGGLGHGAVAIGYDRPRGGKDAVQYELSVTSLGGTSAGDGAAIVMGMNHFTPSTPVEILEAEYPIRVRRFDLWPDSAGAGRQRGGFGYVREYEMLEDAVFTLRGSNHRIGGGGMAGGKGPPVSRTALRPPGANRDRELEAIETRELKAGTILRMHRTGGGGYGDPFERPAELVLADVRDGYVSCEGAARDYGVVIDPKTLAVDKAKTKARRKRAPRRSA